MKPGLALQAIMDEKGITHIQLGDQLGVTDRCINARVKGKHIMRMDTLVSMFDGVGYKIVATPKDGAGREYDLDCE